MADKYNNIDADDIQEGTTNKNFTATDKTKLDGIATGAEVNPDVVPQAEAEAGTATTERIWTAQRVKQAIDALASGGGGNTTTLLSDVSGTTDTSTSEVKITSASIPSGTLQAGDSFIVYVRITRTSGTSPTWQSLYFNDTDDLTTPTKIYGYKPNGQNAGYRIQFFVKNNTTIIIWCDDNTSGFHEDTSSNSFSGDKTITVSDLSSVNQFLVFSNHNQGANTTVFQAVHVLKINKA